MLTAVWKKLHHIFFHASDAKKLSMAFRTWEHHSQTPSRLPYCLVLLRPFAAICTYNIYLKVTMGMPAWAALTHLFWTYRHSAIIRSQGGSGWKETQKLASPYSCTKRGQTTLLRAISSWVWKNSRDGNCTTSLGNLFKCLTLLMKQDFHLSWTSSVSN